jgi:outer membrane receptor protein involved in Fe transport
VLSVIPAREKKNGPRRGRTAWRRGTHFFTTKPLSASSVAKAAFAAKTDLVSKPAAAAKSAATAKASATAKSTAAKTSATAKSAAAKASATAKSAAKTADTETDTEPGRIDDLLVLRVPGRHFAFLESGNFQFLQIVFKFIHFANLRIN